MGQKLNWLAEGRVIHHTIYGDETLESLSIGVSQCRQLIAQSDENRVYVVVDAARLKQYPRDMTALVGVLSPLYLTPKLAGIAYYGDATRDFQRIAEACGISAKIYKSEAEAIDSLPVTLFSHPA